jgi:hypothetical protein
LQVYASILVESEQPLSKTRPTYGSFEFTRRTAITL